MITRLYLRQFRNYKETSLEFGPRINLIHGRNAQGKTNLLEALYLLGTGRSFRTLHLKELIQQETPFFFLEAEFVKDGICQHLRLSFDGQVKKLDYNNTSYAHFSNLLGLLPIVLLAPEDVAIITGAPADRRRFLDLHLAQSDPLYVHHLSRYHKALKQRNFLLKKKSEVSLSTWEALMVTSATYLRQKRQEALTTLAPHLKTALFELSCHQDTLETHFIPSYTDNYAPYRSKDFLLGSTLVGPHRDDLDILINGKSARSFASQGQLRSAIAALRLAEWRQLHELHGTPPLFCIDDFGVHLDAQRRELLLSKLSSFGQVFLTSPMVFETPHATTQVIEIIGASSE
jgi:DNA replication and repair protein RecF